MPTIMGLAARPVRRRSYNNVQTLHARHTEVLRLCALGMKPAEVAEKLGMARSSVYAICESDLGNAQIRSMSEARDNVVKRGDDLLAIQNKINALAPKALERYEELLDSVGTKDTVVASIAKDLLDRAGFAPVRKTENLNANVPVTESTLEKLKARARAAGLVDDSNDSSRVLDVEAEPSCSEAAAIDPPQETQTQSARPRRALFGL